MVAETARANAEAERARYHELWVQACAERDQARADADALLVEIDEARDDCKKKVARVAHSWAEAQSQIAKLEAERAQAAQRRVSLRIDPTKQCMQLVSGECCVLVLGHGGACVKPLPGQDMSDVIRFRLLADRHAALEADYSALALELAQAAPVLAAAEAELEGDPCGYAQHGPLGRAVAIWRAAREG